MSRKTKKILSYYRPYIGLFTADMFFALLASAISLVYPMIVRYITNDILVNYDISESALCYNKAANCHAWIGSFRIS